jgi:uncharacterized protein (TIGR03032 family)
MTNKDDGVSTGPLAYTYTRSMPAWLANHNCSIVISSYKSHNVLTFTGGNDTVEVDAANFPRPMGLATYGGNKKSDTLYVASIGNIFKLANVGPEKEKVDVSQNGTQTQREIQFDAVYYPRSVVLCGDHDLHDLKVTDKGVFYVSSLFNCVCTPSDTKSFAVHWVPPWITKNAAGKLAQEDRCHLNGLCCDNKGVPRYVTSACRSDMNGGWREKASQRRGVVFDIVENKAVCEGLSHPHSPKLHKDKLWILESGTGSVGYVENEKFVPMKFIPGFLRGMCFFENFLMVCSSLDRHDDVFKHIPLGEILKEKETESKCAIWVLNADTMDMVGMIEFTGGVVEQYDIVALPFVKPHIYHVSNSILVERFHV